MCTKIEISYNWDKMFISVAIDARNEGYLVGDCITSGLGRLYWHGQGWTEVVADAMEDGS